jgi:hypothetical protein
MPAKSTKVTSMKKATSMADLLGMQPLTPPKKGAIIQAKIVDLTKKVYCLILAGSRMLY